MVTLNEHALKNKQKLNIDNYDSFTRNRQNSHMGGVSISIKSDEAKHVLKSGEGKENNEFLITRHAQFEPALNVFTVYCEQESRTQQNETENRWGEILEELTKIKLRKERFFKLLGFFITTSLNFW